MKPFEPSIEVSPRSPFLNDGIQVTFTGLKTRSKYTVKALQEDDDGVRWCAECVFTSDPSGMIDLTRRAPNSGSYEGVDPMGLFWSMEPIGLDPSKWQNFANHKTEPILCEISILSDGVCRASVSVERIRVHPSVRRTTLSEDGLVGVLYEPESTACTGALVYLTGSGGGLSETHAAMLASKGIPTLSLAYFGAEELPTELREIPLEYFEQAFGWLKARLAIQGLRIAVAGASRGGELALLLASRMKSICAVVGIVPCCFVNGSYGPNPDDVGAAWTFGGEGLPYFSSQLAREIGEKLRKCWETGGTDGCVDFLLGESRLKETLIPVAEINGPVLLLSGDGDRIWPSAFYGDVIMNILGREEFRFLHEHHHYEGCGHFHPLGYVPTTVTSVIHPVGGGPVELGGRARDVSSAGQDAWARTIAFLRKELS